VASRQGLVKKGGVSVKMSSSSESQVKVLALPGARRTVAGVAVALAGTGLATVVASIPAHRGTAVPALLFLLAVVAAAVVGHLWPALAAAAISFVGLDYFFTPPTHTFVVGKAEDLVALAIFLVVAVAVSAAISAALEQRVRAEFRERQVRALYQVTARLLSGTDLDTVLAELAGVFRTLYGLRWCRVVLLDATGAPRERALSGMVDDDEFRSVPLTAGRRQVGRIEMGGGAPGGIGNAEAEVLTTFAGQLALAVERARLGEEADEARLEAQVSRTRAALFSSVTHDLRTPLSSIMASATSLLEEGVPFSEEQRRELLRTILEESERLNRLVANLMDLSRLRAGALTPSVEPVALEDLASSVLRRLGPLVEGRTIRVTVRDDVPAVPVDVVQMDQVLTNLIENAARFSPPRSAIGIAAVRWQDMVEVRVADRGPGIPPADRGLVFEEFYRRDIEGYRGGTGLGLSIAQAIVTAHGGTMWVEDTPSGGATIGFRLPLARIPAAVEHRTGAPA